MTPDKEHAPALMQQAADEAVARTVQRLRHAAGIMLNHTTATQDVRDELGTAVDEAADTIATLTAQLAAAEREINSLRDYIVYGDEQGVAAGLEMAAKVAEDMTAEDRQQGALAHDHGLSLASVAWKIQAMTKEKIASAIRALADQHKPSPAEEPMP